MKFKTMNDIEKYQNILHHIRTVEREQYLRVLHRMRSIDAEFEVKLGV